MPLVYAIPDENYNGILPSWVNYLPVFIFTIILFITHIKRIKKTSDLKYTFSYKEQTNWYYCQLYASFFLILTGYIFLSENENLGSLGQWLELIFVIIAFITVLYANYSENNFIKKCEISRQHIATALKEITVDFNYARFAIAHPLAKHPLVFENDKIRNQYLNILEIFIRKYAPGDRISQCMLDNYKTFFLGSNGNFNIINAKNIPKTYCQFFKKRHRKGVDAYSLQYVLMCDIITMIGVLDKKCHGVKEELKLYSSSKTHADMDTLLKIMLGENDEQTKKYNLKKNLLEYHLDCWQKNRHFFFLEEKNIMISSNMSSGKSTLINTIIGKKINRSMNEACTSKLHFISDKAFEDNYIYEYDHDLDFNADIETLMEDNPMNKSSMVSVVSYFRYMGEKAARLCLIDSPGVNNSLDKTQEAIKKLILEQNFKIFLYVINAEYIGTTDDLTYLEYLKPALADKQVIFVMNKLDRFRLSEDSIEESIKTIRENLVSIGFENPLVCPVSAYTGFLVKQKLYKEAFDDNQIEEYNLLCKKFSRSEYDLSRFYNNQIRVEALDYIKHVDKKLQSDLIVLRNCGILCLEILLYQGANK
jgi:GTP-binding protein EngB required for normal cell division